MESFCRRFAMRYVLRRIHIGRRHEVGWVCISSRPRIHRNALIPSHFCFPNPIVSVCVCVRVVTNSLLNVHIADVILNIQASSLYPPDAIFGLIWQIIKESSEDLQTPEDIQHLLIRRLKPMFDERGEDFQVVCLQTVRDYEGMLPWQMSLGGAYATVGEVEAPHSYFFVPRAGSLKAHSVYSPHFVQLCFTYACMPVHLTIETCSIHAHAESTFTSNVCNVLTRCTCIQVRTSDQHVHDLVHTPQSHAHMYMQLCEA